MVLGPYKYCKHIAVPLSVTRAQPQISQWIYLSQELAIVALVASNYSVADNKDILNLYLFSLNLIITAVLISRT